MNPDRFPHPPSEGEVWRAGESLLFFIGPLNSEGRVHILANCSLTKFFFESVPDVLRFQPGPLSVPPPADQPLSAVDRLLKEDDDLV